MEVSSISFRWSLLSVCAASHSFPKGSSFAASAIEKNIVFFSPFAALVQLSQTQKADRERHRLAYVTFQGNKIFPLRHERLGIMPEN
jgi:hypothetical protein